MENIRILLCCGVGMSSGFLATSARKAAKKMKVTASIEARSHTDVNDYLHSVDVLMMGPHYGAELEKFKALAEPYGIPVAVIPQKIYAELDGEGLLNLAMKIIEEKG